eukprot:6855858-Karenia_brevis.AAC.1
MPEAWGAIPPHEPGHWPVQGPHCSCQPSSVTSTGPSDRGRARGSQGACPSAASITKPDMAAP